MLCAGAAGCSSASNGRTSDGRLKVVAGENFWGDLARQVGGDHVEVTSLINSPDADPHLFEPGTDAGLAVATAGVVIVNGAGYDPFMNRLINASPSSSRKVVTIANVADVHGSDPNPHLWYDVPLLPDVLLAMRDAMSAADPAHAADYDSGMHRAQKALGPYVRLFTRMQHGYHGIPVAYTERVPGYLLDGIGLDVLTPPSFAQSIENGIEPSAGDVLAMRQLIVQHKIKVLIYNEQATSPITAQLQTLARDNAIPVVPVTETMPAGATFESWQLGQLRRLRAALRA
jgi:zinc/manganese transport system substrate-binding protein